MNGVLWVVRFSYGVAFGVLLKMGMDGDVICQILTVVVALLYLRFEGNVRDYAENEALQKGKTPDE